MARSRDAAACACWGPNRMPDSASASAGSLSSCILPRPRAARTSRVALPGDHRLDDRAGGLVPGQLRHDGRQLAQGVFQQLLQPLPVPRAVRGQVQDVPGVHPQRPDLRRRDERGPQHPHLGQPRDPPRILLVRSSAGPAGSWPGRSSPAAPPARPPPARNNTGRPPARYLWRRSFSGDPRSEPGGHLSMHPALQRC